MKTILCFGDSNLRGAIPGSLNEKTGLFARYPKDKRWTGILQNMLGSDYDVIEEGINGRTTDLDEITPGRSYKNGLTYLPGCLETHFPIDLVIFMIGTNDTKIQFNRSAAEITEGMMQLIKIVKTSNKGPNSTAPRILIIAPPPTIKTANSPAQRDETSHKKTEQLAAFYKQLATKESCDFFDAALVVKSSQIDGVHLDEPDCERLGYAVADEVKKIFI